MNATERYQLKLKIDEALRLYGASAVSWQTSWSELVIRKYDHPYSADRSVIGEWFIKDEADWQQKRVAIKGELARIMYEQEGKGSNIFRWAAETFANPATAKQFAEASSDPWLKPEACKTVGRFSPGCYKPT